MSLAVSPDARIVASVDGTKVVTVWDTSDREIVRSLTHPIGADSVQFSPDGTILATACGRRTRLTRPSAFGQVSLWQPITGKKLHDVTFNQGVNACSFVPDGTRLVAALDGNGAVEVLDVTLGRRIGTLDGSHAADPQSKDCAYGSRRH